MGQPRGTKARRVIDSDENDETSSSRTNGEILQETSRRQVKLPSRAQKEVVTTTSAPSTAGSPSSTAQTTPQKPKPIKQSAKDTRQTKPSTKTIHSFFNASTQAHQRKVPCPVPPQEPFVEELEDIDDAPSDKEPLKGNASGGRKSSVSRKRSSDAISSTQSTSQNARKFLKAADGSRSASMPPSTEVLDHDLRPWTERYAPQTLEELVVHKKKVQDVKQWLGEALQGHKHRRLLVLKGGAGSGKTATLTALSKTLNFKSIEWKNPAMHEFGSDDYVSLSSQFEDFLGRGRRFGGLEVVSTDAARSRPIEVSIADDTYHDKSHLLLIEEFPSNIQRYGAASQAFRSCILQFLSASSMSSLKLTPLVMIISESLLSTSSSLDDNFTAHRLLGPEILHHPSTTVVEFNAVAPTFISKALSTVLQKRSRDTGRYYSPHPDALKRISEFGDVRNATSTLEFLCANATSMDAIAQARGEPSKTRTTKMKVSKTGPESMRDRDAAMSLVSLRESTIGLFHSVGKVVYNKRTGGTAMNGDTSSQPSHLTHHARPLQSEVNCETLMDETGTDPSTFLSALHENYLLSCTPANDNSDAALDAVNGCLDALGDADILGNFQSSTSARFASIGEGLRQADLAFQVGVRGLTFSLPYPVKRKALPGRGKADAFRMFYPADLKLYREREELRESLQLLTIKAMSGVLLDGSAIDRKPAGQVVSQPGRLPGVEITEKHKSADTDDVKSVISIGSGHSALQEMLVERLPYLDVVLSQSKTALHDSVYKQIRRNTRFTGVRTIHDGEEDDDGDNNFGKLQIRVLAAKRGFGFMGASVAGDLVTTDDANTQSLVLSDDDIEDDYWPKA